MLPKSFLVASVLPTIFLLINKSHKVFNHIRHSTHTHNRSTKQYFRHTHSHIKCIAPLIRCISPITHHTKIRYCEHNIHITRCSLFAIETRGGHVGTISKSDSLLRFASSKHFTRVSWRIKVLINELRDISNWGNDSAPHISNKQLLAISDKSLQGTQRNVSANIQYTYVCNRKECNFPSRQALHCRRYMNTYVHILYVNRSLNVPGTLRRCCSNFTRVLTFAQLKLQLKCKRDAPLSERAFARGRLHKPS